MIDRYFVGTPFGLTADLDSSRIWAGRPKQLARLRRLARALETAPESSVDLMWANFGSGKTHALYHLGHLLASTSNAAFAYVEVPEQTRSFLELYSRIVEAIGPKRIANALHSAGSAIVGDADLLRAAQVILNGNTSEQEIATAWLAGSHTPLPQLRGLTGISKRIDDDVRATDKLSACVRAFADQGQRVVICLDEFQRLSLNNLRQGNRIMQSLRTLLSRNSRGLSLVLAIASRAEQTAMDQLPSELKTLIGMKPAIALPTMDEDEAKAFLRERLAAFRPADFEGDAEAPFGGRNLDRIVVRVCEINDGQVGPRQIIQAAGWVLNELGSDSVCDAHVVDELLAELRPES